MKFVSQSYYELLDVDPDAPEEEVKEAYRALKGPFQRDISAIYSLYSPEETEAISAKIEEAFQILTNRDRRRTYDKYLACGEGAEIVPESDFPLPEQLADFGELVPVDSSEENPDRERGWGFEQKAADHGVPAEISLDQENATFSLLDNLEEWSDEAIEATTEESLGLVDGYLEQAGEINAGAPSDSSRLDLSLWFGGTEGAATKPVRPRLKAWSREYAAQRRAYHLSLNLLPLSQKELDCLRAKKVVTGKMLQQIRKKQGIDLETICQLTKISMMTLRFIERERYQSLPSRVYLEGFVEQYVQLMALPDGVVQAYMRSLPDDF